MYRGLVEVIRNYVIKSRGSSRDFSYFSVRKNAPEIAPW